MEKTNITLPRRRSRLIGRLSALCFLLLSLWACMEGPAETPVKEIRFDVIADSLREAGFTHIEITAIRDGMAAPVKLYESDLAPGQEPGVLTLPDVLGNDYTITVKATKPVDKVFYKVYTIHQGALSGTPVVTPPKEDSTDPDVKLPQSVAILPESLALGDQGDTATLKATITPSEADQRVQWSSSNPGIASVDANGLIHTGMAGKAVIKAQSIANPSKSATAGITVVTPAIVTSIVVMPDSLSVRVGATSPSLALEVYPIGTPALVNWRSSAPTVATVSADGKVTGLSPGAAYISAHAKNDETKSDSCKVVVVQDSVSDTLAPVVIITSPAENSITDKGQIAVTWSVDGVPQTTLLTETLAAEGANAIIRTATDAAGNKGSDTVVVIKLSKAPGVAILTPKTGLITNLTSVPVDWSVDGTLQTVQTTEALPLEGENLIIRTATNGAGLKSADTVKVIRDTQSPKVLITSPSAGAVIGKASTAVAWTVDGVAQTTLLTETLPLEGENVIKRVATDLAGNKDSASIKVIRNTKGSSVLITSPADGFVTNKTSIAVAWTVDGKAQTTLLTETLATEGVNVIIREHTDSSGNKSADTIRVTRDTQVPVVAITAPADSAKVTANSVTVAWKIDGVVQTAQTTEILSAGDGHKTITRIALDAAGNSGLAAITVILDKDKPAGPVMTAATSPTNAASVVWKWSSGIYGNGTFRYRLDNPDLTTGATTVTVYQVSIPSLADGAHTLYVQERDAEGNWSPSASKTIIVDRTAPTMTIDGGSQTVASSAFTLSATIKDTNGIASVSVAGAASGNGAMTLTSGKYTRAVTLASGANTLIVTATDSAGNVKTGSVVVTFTLPAITISYPPDGFVTNNGSITVSYTVAGNSTVKTKAVILADGAQTITISETGASSASVQVYVYSNVVFVRKAAAAGGDGSSWDKAYNDLNTALKSTAGKKSGNKIWIGAGTYTNLDAASSGFFELASGVSLYGSFPATGRPFTEAGRNFASDKTIFTCGATWGGILRLAGNSNVDGIIFNQTVLGPQTIYVNISAIFSNCEFHGTQQPNDFIYVREATTTFDKCTFSNLTSTGAVINLFLSDATITNSSFKNNSCRYLVYLDGREVNLSNTTISGNTSWDPDIAFPAFKIWNGSLHNLGGVISDKALLQTDG
jgi:uncharacterized protein YjdB